MVLFLYFILFGEKEIKDIKDSITELEVEMSMRKLFIAELETLL